MKEGKFISKGMEKDVFEHPYDPKKVVKSYRYTPEVGPEESERVRAQYYLGKILHILYPKNFPDIHASTSRPHQIVSERVDLDGLHTQMSELFQKTKEENRLLTQDELDRAQDIRESMSKQILDKKVSESMKERGLNLDDTSANFSINNEGEPVFVDNVWPWNNASLKFIPEKIKEAIDSIQDETKRKLATKYFERLMRLYKEVRQ